jgi:PAS domain S-box-containing protein
MSIRLKVLLAFGAVAMALMAMVALQWWGVRRMHHSLWQVRHASGGVQAYVGLSGDVSLWMEEALESDLLGEGQAEEARQRIVRTLDGLGRLADQDAEDYGEAYVRQARDRIARLEEMLPAIAGGSAAATAVRAGTVSETAGKLSAEAAEQQYKNGFVPLLAEAVAAQRAHLEAAAGDLEALEARLAALSAALAASSVALIAVVGFALVRSITGPVKRLSAGTSAIASGDLGHRVGYRGRDELAQLARRFDGMADQLAAQRERLLAAQSELEQKNRALEEGVARRKHMEETLHDYTAKLSALAEERGVLLAHTRDFVYRLDTRGVFTYLSPAVEQLTGHSVEEWLTHYSAYMTDSPINEKVYEYTEDALRSGREYPPYLVEIYHKNGGRLMLEVSERPCFEEGKVAGLIGVARDVTERVRVEEALRRSQEQHRAIVENVGIGIALISPRMEILELNRTLRQRFPHIDVTQRPVCYRAYNDPPREEPCSYCPTINTLRDGLVHEAATETPAAGRVRNYRIVSSPLFDAEGKVVAAIEMVEDITERREAEEALRESQRKYQHLFHNLYDAALVADAETGCLLDANARAESLLGRPRSELIGLHFTELHPPGLAQEYRRRFQAHRDPGGAMDYDGEAMRKDGTPVPVRISVSQVTIGGRGCLLALFRDITERKRVEKELERYAERLEALNDELARSNRDLEAFTHTVSHDLQEPLRKVHAFGQFLMEDCADQLPQAGREHLQRMLSAADRMKELIGHLLSLARVGTQGGEPVSTDLGQVANRALETISEQVRQSGAEVTVPRDLPRVKGDAVQLEQVFQNLVGNALKFRSPDRAPKVAIRADADGKWVTVHVTDNGIGIEGKDFERIFGLFERLHPEQYEGAGIGLPLCAKVINRHGGRIWVESEPGQGSTFSFTLRAAEKEGADA